MLANIAGNDKTPTPKVDAQPVQATPTPTPTPEPKKEDIEPPRPTAGQEISQEYFKWLERKVAFDCQQAIKRRVSYNMRSDGIFYGENDMDSMNFLLRFDQWTKYVRKDNSVTIRGDRAEAQNGFGNWVRANYSCTFDINTHFIINASVDGGRLN